MYCIKCKMRYKIESQSDNALFFFFVRLIGLEPTRRKTPDPKSGASTNFATGALFLIGHPTASVSVLRPIASLPVRFQMSRREITGCKDSRFWRFYQIFDLNVCPPTAEAERHAAPPVVFCCRTAFGKCAISGREVPRTT